MDKNIRDSFRHYQRIEYDLLSDEEIEIEKREFLALRSELEGRRLLNAIFLSVFMMATIFEFTLAFLNNSMVIYVLCVGCAVLAAVFFYNFYRDDQVIKTLREYWKKLCSR